MPLPLSRGNSLPDLPLVHAAVLDLLRVQWVGTPCGVVQPPCAHNILIYCMCVSCFPTHVLCGTTAVVLSACAQGTSIVSRCLSNPQLYLVIYGKDCGLCAAPNSLFRLHAQAVQASSALPLL